MFVSDSNIFPSSDMKIRLTGPDGMDIIVSVCPDSTVDTLKVAALGNLLQDPTGSMKESLYYKVVLVRTCKALEDDKTLIEQDVQDNGMCFKTVVKRLGCKSLINKITSKG